MEVISMPVIFAPVLWLALGIIFAVKGLDVKKALVLMLTSARSCGWIALLTLWPSLVGASFSLGFLLIIMIVPNLAFIIGMMVVVIMFRGDLSARIISAGIFAFACLIELSIVIQALLGFPVTRLYLGLGEIFSIAASLVFILGAKK